MQDVRRKTRRHKTTRPDEIYQCDATMFVIPGWGRYKATLVVDDFLRKLLAVATVGLSGLVTFTQTGFSTITVTNGSVSVQTAFTVTQMNLTFLSYFPGNRHPPAALCWPRARCCAIMSFS
jgi:hypothetical protein